MLWFKHRSDARNSLKLRKVRRKYGADGYAIYWFCLEAIAYDVDKDNLTFELREDAETIGFELSIQEKRVMEIMMYMVEIGLFESSSNMITCMKLAESLDKSMTNSPKMRKWLDGKKLPVSADVMTLLDDANTCPELEVEVEVEVEVEEKIKKTTAIAVDYSVLQMSNDELSELKRVRKKNKGGTITQRVANELAKQFMLAANMGYSFDEILTEWETRSWKSFKAEWLKPKQLQSGMSALMQQNIQNTIGWSDE